VLDVFQVSVKDIMCTPGATEYLIRPNGLAGTHVVQFQQWVISLLDEGVRIAR